jgi:hypothetical protein
MVAAKAEEASACTIGALVARTLADVLSTLDRVFNGPTNEVWIDPWRNYLQSRGVNFHLGFELESMAFDRDTREIRSLKFEPFRLANTRRLRRALANVRAGLDIVGRRGRSWSDKDELVRHPDAFLGDLKEDLKTAVALIAELRVHGWQHADAEEVLGAFAQRLETPPQASARPCHDDPVTVTLAALERQCAEVELDFEAVREHAADYFVFALPLEQMAYYVGRSPMARFLDPGLDRLTSLALHLDWMAGIQFYLRTPFDTARGHIVSLDSPWALTALEQTQFWRDVPLPAGCKGVISVDIAAWDRKGRFCQKETYNCDDREIAREVWDELKAMFNRDDRSPVLRDEMLWQGPDLHKGVNFHLDDSIVDLRDRKKQAMYEKARGVRFSTEELIARAGEETEPAESYIWGRRQRFNAEPILVNRVGSQLLRPEARTGIRNMFLAADYVKTETDLACMEGANEAARRAVNGILDAVGSRQSRCQLWSFSVPQQVLESMTQGGLSSLLSGARGVRAAASQLADRLWATVGEAVSRNTSNRR